MAPSAIASRRSPNAATGSLVPSGPSSPRPALPDAVPRPGATRRRRRVHLWPRGPGPPPPSACRRRAAGRRGRRTAARRSRPRPAPRRRAPRNPARRRSGAVPAPSDDRPGPSSPGRARGVGQVATARTVRDEHAPVRALHDRRHAPRPQRVLQLPGRCTGREHGRGEEHQAEAAQRGVLRDAREEHRVLGAHVRRRRPDPHPPVAARGVAHQVLQRLRHGRAGVRRELGEQLVRRRAPVERAQHRLRREPDRGRGTARLDVGRDLHEPLERARRPARHDAREVSWSRRSSTSGGSTASNAAPRSTGSADAAGSSPATSARPGGASAPAPVTPSSAASRSSPATACSGGTARGVRQRRTATTSDASSGRSGARASTSRTERRSRGTQGRDSSGSSAARRAPFSSRLPTSHGVRRDRHHPRASVAHRSPRSSSSQSSAVGVGANVGGSSPSSATRPAAAATSTTAAAVASSTSSARAARRRSRTRGPRAQDARRVLGPVRDETRDEAHRLQTGARGLRLDRRRGELAHLGRGRRRAHVAVGAAAAQREPHLARQDDVPLVGRAEVAALDQPGRRPACGRVGARGDADGRPHASASRMARAPGGASSGRSTDGAGAPPVSPETGPRPAGCGPSTSAVPGAGRNPAERVPGDQTSASSSRRASAAVTDARSTPVARATAAAVAGCPRSRARAPTSSTCSVSSSRPASARSRLVRFIARAASESSVEGRAWRGRGAP